MKKEKYTEKELVGKMFVLSNLGIAAAAQRWQQGFFLYRAVSIVFPRGPKHC